mgnify:CR=1 FL=1
MVIFRLKSEVTIFFKEAFNCCFIFKHCNNNIAIIGIRCFFSNYNIIV